MRLDYLSCCLFFLYSILLDKIFWPKNRATLFHETGSYNKTYWGVLLT